MTDRQKRILRLVAFMITLLGILYFIGSKVVQHVEERRVFVDNQISRLNSLILYNHMEDLRILTDCTATVLGRQTLMTEAERGDIAIQLTEVRKHNDIEDSVFSSEYYVHDSDFAVKFNNYLEGLKIIVENKVFSEEAFAYINGYHQVLMELSELLLDLDRNARDEEKFDDIGVNDLEESIYVNMVEGKLMSDYLNASHGYFDQLWTYNDYLKTLVNTYYSVPSLEENTDIEKVAASWNAEEVELLKDELFRRLESLGYRVVDIKSDQQYEFESLIQKMNIIADVFSEFEVVEKQIIRPTHIPEIIGGTFSQCLGKFHDLDHDLGIELGEQGIIRSINLRYLDQYLPDFELSKIVENSIDQDMKRLEPFLPAEIKSILIDTTIIRNYEDRILYQLELKKLDSTIYYYVDYNTFEFVEVDYIVR